MRRTGTFLLSSKTARENNSMGVIEYFVAQGLNENCTVVRTEKFVQEVPRRSIVLSCHTENTEFFISLNVRTNICDCDIGDVISRRWIFISHHRTFIWFLFGCANWNVFPCETSTGRNCVKTFHDRHASVSYAQFRLFDIKYITQIYLAN